MSVLGGDLLDKFKVGSMVSWREPLSEPLSLTNREKQYGIIIKTFLFQLGTDERYVACAKIACDTGINRCLMLNVLKLESEIK